MLLVFFPCLHSCCKLVLFCYFSITHNLLYLHLTCSVSETWNNVLHLPSDVKELIPEFYQPEMADFLVNRKGLKLGTCQDGSTVTNVTLPPWADGKLPTLYL